MLVYLVLTILSSSGLLVILKYFHLWKADTLHSIIVNYWTAVAWSCTLGYAQLLHPPASLAGAWPFALVTGLLFIIVFFITGMTAQKAGVAIASVASKMSMIIPITAGLVLYGEHLYLKKALGLVLALPAVVMISLPRTRTDRVEKSSWTKLLPVILFLGAGMVDTAIKFGQARFMNAENRELMIMFIFGSAGMFGIARLIFEWRVLHKTISRESVLPGMLLGTVNYFSLYFLIRCLETPGSESSTIFAFVNIGVVISSFIAGRMLFGERSDGRTFGGLVMAVIAIVLLSA